MHTKYDRREHVLCTVWLRRDVKRFCMLCAAYLIWLYVLVLYLLDVQFKKNRDYYFFGTKTVFFLNTDTNILKPKIILPKRTFQTAQIECFCLRSKERMR